MRQGCFGFLLQLGTSVVSAVLIAVGALLLIVGLVSSSPESGLRTVLPIAAALLAAYVFVQVGRSIWRDLRKSRLTEQEQEDSSGPSSVENYD